MSRRKSIDTGNAPKGAPADLAVPGKTTLVVVPRLWLIVLTAMVCVPWLIAAAIYIWGVRDPSGRASEAADRAPSEAGSAALGAQGPWGQLEVTPIVISPPLELVPTNWGPIEPPRWHFPQTSHKALEQFLASAGLDSRQVAELLSSARFDPRINGLVVSPSRDLVKALSPEVRASIYVQLAKSPLNDRQRNAYRHFGSSAAAWLGRSRIPPEIVKLVEPFVYPVGDFLYFSDIDLVRSEVGDGPQLQRLAKGLLREATVLVRLRLSDDSQVDAVAEYWGRGGRRTDIRPLLESIAAGGPQRSIDISHLLPPMARQYLYRYPQISLKDLEKGALVNCFWTALNFFNARPDDRFLNAAYAVETLKRDYHIIHDQFQLGDIAAFADSNGNHFHAAVYLADNLVFGKNGTSSLSPWTIVPIERLKGYYVEHAGDWNVTFYRRNDL